MGAVAVGVVSDAGAAGAERETQRLVRLEGGQHGLRVRRSATATPDVIADITKQLGVGALRVINTGVHRPNLVGYVVRPVADDTDKQRQFLEIARG